MTSRERWVRLKELLARAFELAPEELPAYLDRVSAGDAELREELARVLRACELARRSLGFLDSPAAVFLAPLLEAEDRTPVESLELEPGLEVGPYVLQRYVGAGGMGVVYLARDPRLDRLVALKLLPAWLLTEEGADRRLADEARAASRLDHPNIQTIYEIARTPDGRPYIAMAFYDGETLTERLSQGPLAIDSALDLARQVADGLAAAHAHGIVHRDIKPGNVIVTSEGIAKILDFGAAKVTDRALANRGAVVGTVAYMSPEQTRGEEVDVRSDVWSLGVVVYEKLTGRHPFAAGDAEAVMRAIADARPVPVRELRPDVPETLAAVVHRCLEKEPRDRFANGTAVRGALLRIPEAHGGASSARRGRRSSRTPRAAALGAVILAAAAILWPTVRPGPATRARLGADAPTTMRLAILPLVDPGGGAEHAYVAEGLTRELIARLSVLESVQVIDQASMARLEDRDMAIPEIARELGVHTVLSGEIDPEGAEVRFSLEMVDAVSLARLWEHDGTAPIEELPTVASEIASEVAAALRVDVGERARRLMGRGETTSAAAFAMYFRGRHFLAKLETRDASQAAREAFEDATDLDPGFAPAWAGLATAYHQLGMQGYLPTGDAARRARQAAERALELDPELAAAHAVEGAVLSWYAWEPEEAERHFERALELEPNGGAYRPYAVHLRNQGRFDEALTAMERVTELDPLSPGNYLQRGVILYMGRRYDEALEAYRRVLLLDPQYTVTHFYMALLYAQMDRFEQALSALEQMDPDVSRMDGLTIRGYVLARLGRRDEARETLTRLDSVYAPFPTSFAKAVIHVGLGELDRALDLLEQGARERAWQMQLLKVEPVFDPLRSSPRFRKLLEELHLVG